jgi:hypothetical protein
MNPIKHRREGRQGDNAPGGLGLHSAPGRELYALACYRGTVPSKTMPYRFGGCGIPDGVIPSDDSALQDDKG